ncbi:MAG: hypothetical protein AVDCRST_MAG73-1433, partial [uncultured Thermomicrobiales bacterium]
GQSLGAAARAGSLRAPGRRNRRRVVQSKGARQPHTPHGEAPRALPRRPDRPDRPPQPQRGFDDSDHLFTADPCGRALQLGNLRHAPAAYPFYHLDPRIAGFGGAKWWTPRLGAL